MRRICSLEYEYGLLDEKSLQFPLKDKINAVLNEKTYSIHKNLRTHLKNGTQLYLDITSHIEAALPECSNPRDLVLYDEAISRILTELGKKHGILFFKNNIDSYGASFGCHENYFINKKQIRDISKANTDDKALMYIARLITPFLITRIIYTGSGSVANGKYLLSQRARIIKTRSSINTTFDRPIFNLRNEPLSDIGLRVHIIAGDSNMSEFSTYLKTSLTTIILSMIESGFLRREFILEEPIKIFHAINENGVNFKFRSHKGKNPFRAAKKLSPVEIQRWYLEKARDFFAKYPSYIDADTETQLNSWQFVIDSLQTNPDALNRHIDWVIKKSLMGNKKAFDIEAEKIDILYHLIGEKGLYYSLRDELNLERIVTDEEIEKAMNNPPADTRAFGRTNILQRLIKRGYRIEGATWDSISYQKNKTKKIIPLGDPNRTYKDITIED